MVVGGGRRSGNFHSFVLKRQEDFLGSGGEGRELHTDFLLLSIKMCVGWRNK